MVQGEAGDRGMGSLHKQAHNRDFVLRLSSPLDQVVCTFLPWVNNTYDHQSRWGTAQVKCYYMKVTDMMWPAPCGTFPGKAQSWKTALLSSQGVRNRLRQHLCGNKCLHGQIMLICWTSKLSFMTLGSLHELPTFLNSPPGSIALPFMSQIHRLSVLHSSLCLEYSHVSCHLLIT